MLKFPGTKDKANLYLTNLIQVLYTVEELVALQPADTHNDVKYQLLQGNNLFFLSILIVLFLEAIRCKFKLTSDQVQEIFNEWLREVFLAKRRVAVAKMKLLNNN